MTEESPGRSAPARHYKRRSAPRVGHETHQDAARRKRAAIPRNYRRIHLGNWWDLCCFYHCFFNFGGLVFLFFLPVTSRDRRLKDGTRSLFSRTPDPHHRPKQPAVAWPWHKLCVRTTRTTLADESLALIEHFFLVMNWVFWKTLGLQLKMISKENIDYKDDVLHFVYHRPHSIIAQVVNIFGRQETILFLSQTIDNFLLILLKKIIPDVWTSSRKGKKNKNKYQYVF